jgi:hypothetical protein
MNKMPKVGDRVKLKPTEVAFAGLQPGEVGVVTKITGIVGFEVNNISLNCHPDSWIKMKPKAKKPKEPTVTITEAEFKRRWDRGSHGFDKSWDCCPSALSAALSALGFKK